VKGVLKAGKIPILLKSILTVYSVRFELF